MPSRLNSGVFGASAARASIVFAVILSIPSSARGEDATLPRVSLEYVVTGARDACPDERVFRRHVATRLGYDPFAAGSEAAPRKMQVSIAASRSPHSASISLIAPGGSVVGERTLTAASCDDLVADAAFTASVAIDPSVLARGTDPPNAPASEPSDHEIQNDRSKPAAPSDSAPAATTRPDLPFVPSMTLGSSAGLGALPATAVGFYLAASLRRESLSFGATAFATLPNEAAREATDATHTSEAITSVTLETSLFTFALDACGHFDTGIVSPYLCGVAQVGALRGASKSIARTREDISPWVAVGPRLGASVTLARNFALDIHVDGAVPLTVIELRVDDRALWRSPRIVGFLGAGITYSFR